MSSSLSSKNSSSFVIGKTSFVFGTLFPGRLSDLG